MIINNSLSIGVPNNLFGKACSHMNQTSDNLDNLWTMCVYGYAELDLIWQYRGLPFM